MNISKWTKRQSVDKTAGQMVRVSESEALRIITSLSAQLEACNHNKSRAEFHTEDGEYFSIAVEVPFNIQQRTWLDQLAKYGFDDHTMLDAVWRAGHDDRTSLDKSPLPRRFIEAMELMFPEPKDNKEVDRSTSSTQTTTNR